MLSRLDYVTTGKRSLCFQVFALDESTAKLLKKVSEPL